MVQLLLFTTPLKGGASCQVPQKAGGRVPAGGLAQRETPIPAPLPQSNGVSLLNWRKAGGVGGGEGDSRWE